MDHSKISQEKLDELRCEHKKLAKSGSRTGIRSFFYSEADKAFADAAEVVMVDENTVRKEVQAWNSGGI